MTEPGGAAPAPTGWLTGAGGAHPLLPAAAVAAPLLGAVAAPLLSDAALTLLTGKPFSDTVSILS